MGGGASPEAFFSYLQIIQAKFSLQQRSGEGIFSANKRWLAEKNDGLIGGQKDEQAKKS
jgi:hypothetical protein